MEKTGFNQTRNNSSGNNISGLVTQSTAVGIQGFSLGPIYFGDFAHIRFPIYGIAWPIATLLTAITSMLICGVLFRRSMRTSTNIVLGTIALANMMTCLVPLPILLYLFWTDAHTEYIKPHICNAFKLTAVVAPVMFHNMSIWLTILMAMQQVVMVRYPLRGKNWVTVRTTVLATIAISFVAVFGHFNRVIDSFPQLIEIPSKVNPNVTVAACEEIMMPWVQNPNTYFSIYFWCRAFLMHIFPCIMLVVLNCVLIHTMRLAFEQRKVITGNPGKTSSQSQSNNRTTGMLVAIISVFLLVELPSGIMLILVVVPNAFGIQLLSLEVQYHAITIGDLIILCSYPFNFIIYSTMSRRFRQVFSQTFCCARKSQDVSLKNSTTNGESRSTTVSGAEH